MLRSKSTKLFSEITCFFSTSEKAIIKTMEVYKVVKIAPIKFEKENNWPKEYKPKDLLLVLLLMPLFSAKNVAQYLTSSIFQYIETSKATLYRFKNDERISWRKILQTLNKRIIQRIVDEGTEDSTKPKCLIVDDTDFSKVGKYIEQISRIWSHVKHCSSLGFKGLLLGYWDSKTFIGLDFSLHKETGKNKKYPNGLKPSENKKQFKKVRKHDSCGQSRIEELLLNKIDNAITMIKRASQNHIAFEYVLMDSWFLCDKIIKEVRSIGAHVIGMGKIGKATYDYKGKNRTAKYIVDDLRKHKKTRWSRVLMLYVTETNVEYKGTKLKLLFCRNTKRGKWHLLISTNIGLSAIEMYEVYSIRWSIEVFFKEAKQHFGLGKSQSRDFDAQIADTTISILQYNIFSLAKRFGAYETLGELFREAKDAIIELTVCQRIWEFFLEIINIISEVFEIEPDDMMEQFIAVEPSDNKLMKLMHYQLKNAA